MVTLTMPRWVLGVLGLAVFGGGLALTTLVPEPYNPWAKLLAVTWFWLPLLWEVFRPGPWRSRKQKRADAVWRAEATVRGERAAAAYYAAQEESARAAQDEAQRVEDNQANG